MLGRLPRKAKNRGQRGRLKQNGNTKESSAKVKIKITFETKHGVFELWGACFIYTAV